jgi:hypothetical protein
MPVSSPPWWLAPALGAITVLCAAMAVVTGRRRARRRVDPPASSARSDVLDVENGRPIG